MTNEENASRRRFPRAGPVVIRCVFSIGDTTDEGYLVSPGEGGAFLSTDMSIEIGETVALCVNLPWQTGDILTQADVICAIGVPHSGPHQSSPGVGLSFTNLAPEDQERLRQYVAKSHELAARIEQSNISERPE